MKKIGLFVLSFLILAAVAGVFHFLPATTRITLVKKPFRAIILMG